jgi:hypothetical protein
MSTCRWLAAPHTQRNESRTTQTSTDSRHNQKILSAEARKRPADGSDRGDVEGRESDRYRPSSPPVDGNIVGDRWCLEVCDRNGLDLMTDPPVLDLSFVIDYACLDRSIVTRKQTVEAVQSRSTVRGSLRVHASTTEHRRSLERTYCPAHLTRFLLIFA